MGLKFVSVLASTIALSVMLPAFAQDGASEPMSPQDAFDARQHQMRDFGRTMRELRNVEGDAMIAAADIYVEGFGGMEARFPEGSIVDGSHALPVIWEDWEGFLALIEKGNGIATQMRIAAESNDQTAFLAAAQNLGPLCQECHNTYRAEME